MDKEIARKLAAKAEEVAVKFSSPDREFNYAKEEFKVEQVQPLSEYSAFAVFCKTSGKKALAFFYYISANEGYWCYFFPRESHIVGMEKLKTLLDIIDRHNFRYNFQISEQASLYSTKK